MAKYKKFLGALFLILPMGVVMKAVLSLALVLAVSAVWANEGEKVAEVGTEAAAATAPEAVAKKAEAKMHKGHKKDTAAPAAAAPK